MDITEERKIYMTSLGIDYGNGKTNVDVNTGIRYGIISANDLPYWDEESEPDYGEPHCPECGGDADDYDSTPEEITDKMERYGHCYAEYCCRDCNIYYDSEAAFPEEANCYFIKDENLEAFSDSYRDVWITKSPYFTHAQFCSPCAPGACHLGSPLQEPWDNNRAYCPPLDWFEDEKPPFSVYLVATGECIYTPEKEEEENLND